MCPSAILSQADLVPIIRESILLINQSVEISIVV